MNMHDWILVAGFALQFLWSYRADNRWRGMVSEALVQHETRIRHLEEGKPSNIIPFHQGI